MLEDKTRETVMAAAALPVSGRYGSEGCQPAVDDHATSTVIEEGAQGAQEAEARPEGARPRLTRTALHNNTHRKSSTLRTQTLSMRSSWLRRSRRICNCTS